MKFSENWLRSMVDPKISSSELSHLLCFPVVHLPKGELVPDDIDTGDLERRLVEASRPRPGTTMPPLPPPPVSAA